MFQETFNIDLYCSACCPISGKRYHRRNCRNSVQQRESYPCDHSKKARCIMVARVVRAQHLQNIILLKIYFIIRQILFISSQGGHIGRIQDKRLVGKPSHPGRRDSWWGVNNAPLEAGFVWASWPKAFVSFEVQVRSQVGATKFSFLIVFICSCLAKARWVSGPSTPSRLDKPSDQNALSYIAPTRRFFEFGFILSPRSLSIFVSEIANSTRC